MQCHRPAHYQSLLARCLLLVAAITVVAILPATILAIFVLLNYLLLACPRDSRGACDRNLISCSNQA